MALSFELSSAQYFCQSARLGLSSCQISFDAGCHNFFSSFSFCNPHLCGYTPADETHQRFGFDLLPTGYHVFHMRDCGLVGLWFNFHPFGGCGLGGGIGKAHCWVAFPLCQGWHFCLCWLVHPTIVLSLLLALQISLHDIWVGRAHG